MPKQKSEQMDFAGLEIVADEFTGTFNGTVEVDASGVDVAGYPAGGITAGTLQVVLNALADRIEALENP